MLCLVCERRLLLDQLIVKFFLLDQLESLHDAIDALVQLGAAIHQFVQLRHGGLFVDKHQLYLFEEVHHIQLVHEHLHCMHGLLEVSFNNVLRLLSSVACSQDLV